MVTTLSDFEMHADRLTKICKKCDESKPIEEFHRAPQNKDGRSGSCKTCDNVLKRAWKTANRKRHNENGRRWRESDPERYREYKRRYLLQSNYGITPKEYDEMLAAQDGVCACCRTSDPGGGRSNFCVDHCHETGRIRGVLCNTCNTAIGMLGDTVESIDRVAAYMHRSLT